MPDIVATVIAESKADPKKVPRVPASHPKYSEMIVQAIVSLKERGGSSRAAILKYILKHFQVGGKENAVNSRVKLALKAGVTGTSLKQANGTGASGSFKIGDKPIVLKKKAQPHKEAKPRKTAMKITNKSPKVEKKLPAAKKVKTNKNATEKSVTKKLATKKPLLKKLTPLKPVAKKPSMKKLTAVKPVAKKTSMKKLTVIQPVAKKPSIKKLTSVKPVAKKSSTKNPAAEKIVSKKSPIQKSAQAKNSSKKTATKKEAVTKAKSPKTTTIV